jgi:hypothetical protein
MNLKIPSLDQITSQFIFTFKRFPLAVISALITMVIIIFLIDVDRSDYPHLEILLHTVFVTSLGIFMFTAFRLFTEKNILCLIGVVLLIGYYLVLPDMLHPPDMIFQRHIFLFLLFFIMIFWAKFWKESPSNEEFWEFTQRVVFGFFISIIFSIVLYAGISGALFAVDKLFSLYIDPKRYVQLWFLVVGLFGVTYFLSQIPKSEDKLTAHAHTKVEMIFTKYILTPITISYFIILYAYTAKILITAAFPKGILAWIIVAFSAVAIVTYLSWTPFWSEKSKKYRRFLFLALFLQTIMLGVAISMRVAEYAWTENRYLIALLGVWLFGISLYFLLFKNAKYKWIFISLSLIIAVSQIGSFSAYNVGQKSQQNRLKTVLQNNPSLSDESDVKLRYEISDIISYLYRHYGKESLKPVLPKIVTKYENQSNEKKRNWFVAFVTKELGFEYVSRWDMKAELKGDMPFSVYRRMSGILNVSGYDWVVDLYYERETLNVVANKKIGEISKIATKMVLTDKKLEIKENNKTISTISLENYYSSLLKDKHISKRRAIDVSGDKLTFIHKDENVSVKILFLDIFADKNGTFKNIGAKVLYKRR